MDSAGRSDRGRCGVQAGDRQRLGPEPGRTHSTGRSGPRLRQVLEPSRAGIRAWPGDLQASSRRARRNHPRREPPRGASLHVHAAGHSNPDHDVSGRVLIVDDEQEIRRALKTGLGYHGFEHRRVSVGGRTVHLTPTEYEVLRQLAIHAGKPVTHTMLLREVWGEYAIGDRYNTRYVITQLRKKLGDDPARPRYISTEPGVGYRLEAD